MRRDPHWLRRLERVLERIEARLEADARGPVLEGDGPAWRWRDGRLWPVPEPRRLALDDLLGMDRQKREVMRNLSGFVAGRPANHMLLWGARGTGKSSLVRAAFSALEPRGLRLIEVDTDGLARLPEIAACVQRRCEPFLLYCDDLSFAADDQRHTTLKALLDGSVAAPPANLLICATSNRRHLLPEFLEENRQTRTIDGEIHPGEAIEEKISLSERFGLWLSFRPFDQQTYLDICAHWLRRLGDVRDPGPWREAALRWATARGSRSGRVARQFAIDWLGRRASAHPPTETGT